MTKLSRSGLIRRRIISDIIYLLVCMVGVIWIAVTGYYWAMIVPVLSLILGIFILRYHLKEYRELSE